jgi:DNA-binding MarR family transcriptional regulator
MKRADEQRERLAEEVGTLAGPLIRELRAAFAAGASELGLGLAEAHALWLIGTRDGLTTKDVARSLDLDPANTSTLLTRLVRRELLSRAPAPHDRRRRVLSLTEEGRLLRRRLADRVGELRPTFSELSTAELRTLRDLLRKLQPPPSPA